MSTSSVIPPSPSSNRNPLQSQTLRGVLATTAVVFLTALLLSNADLHIVDRITAFVETRWQAGLNDYGIHFFSVSFNRFFFCHVCCCCSG
jgi:hypothetical protein